LRQKRAAKPAPDGKKLGISAGLISTKQAQYHHTGFPAGRRTFKREVTDASCSDCVDGDGFG
jgi:hypothetical protein